MKKIALSITGIFLIASFLLSGVINEDKPLKGMWNFNMVKLWEVEEAGKDFFVSMRIRSDENETVFVADQKNFKTYIFDKSGKFILSFGKKGEGPGEMKRFGSLYLENNKLIYYENNRVHYFSKEGKYIETVIIPGDLTPRLFIDENSFISAPRMNWEDPKGESRCIIYNVKDKNKKLLFEYFTYKKGVARRASKKSRSTFSFSNSSITPMLVLAYRDNKIYFGMNNEYKIKVKDLKSRDEFDFSIKRKEKFVPGVYKNEILKGVNFPADVKRQIKEGLPDHFTFFEGILIDRNGNIYVFVTDPVEENSRKIDIFSAGGTYIYSAEIKVEKGLVIRSSHFSNDKLYMGVENEDGDLKLVKYKIDIPKISLRK
ncbi:MAG: 6-bladed beta-propeller [Candidatus Aminicenantes bacterium]|nr:6-bladed beta-propeller [Candidatus Aminicenantes bacterium]